MDVDADAEFEAQLARAGVAFSSRDARLLEAIREQGSLNAAAEALGRSYSRSQQRVVELEEAFGRLVERKRGGAGGGGSSLTETAERLLAEFDRLEVEFAGVTEVADTVLGGTVLDREGELGTVETAAGSVRAIVPPEGSDVRVAIRADAVTLHAPGSLPEAETSARNRFRGTVRSIDPGDALAQVTLDVGADADLRVLVTKTSIETLGLAAGETVVASFKATATRAVPARRYRDRQ